MNESYSNQSKLDSIVIVMSDLSQLYALCYKNKCKFATWLRYIRSSKINLTSIVIS